MHHPRRKPKSIHSDSVTGLSLHSSRQVFVVSFASVCYQSKMISFFYSSDLDPENPFCHFLRIIWKYMWYWLICFPSFLVFYVAFYLTFYSGILFWHPIWHPFWYLFWNFSGILSDILSGICSDILSGIYSGILSDILFWHSIWHLFWHSLWHVLKSGTAHWDLGLGVRVRQCPLRSGGHGWRLAVPTQRDLELAFEVRQCPLRSGARGSGLAVGSEIWSSRLRSGSAHWNLELAVGR